MRRRSVDKYGNQFPCKPLHAVIWLDTLGQDTSPAPVAAVRKLVPDDFDQLALDNRCDIDLVNEGG